MDDMQENDRKLITNSNVDDLADDNVEKRMRYCNIYENTDGVNELNTMHFDESAKDKARSKLN